MHKFKKWLLWLTITLLALLSLGSGFAKLLQSPQEMAFLSQFGLSVTIILAFGSLQLVGGICLAIPISRRLGAAVVGLCFGISMCLLGLSGQLLFAAVSLLPVALSLWVFMVSVTTQRSQMSDDER